MNPFQVVRDFESEVGKYTGAPHVVSVSSCTMGLLIAVAWSIRDHTTAWSPYPTPDGEGRYSTTVISREAPKEKRVWVSRIVRPHVEIPKRTYCSVPMSIVHAGGHPTFRDEEWTGMYQLKPLPVWDAARRFTSGMYVPGTMQCVSFHWSKILGVQQGGAILLDDPIADAWLRRARFDGRTEGVAPKDDRFGFAGWHCYLSPELAAAGMVRLHHLPKDNPDRPNDDYPDLSQQELFR